MRRRLFAMVVVCLFSFVITKAQSGFKVNEAETKAFFDAGKLLTNLVLDNSSPSFDAKIKLEILDTEDRIIASRENFQTIKRGKQTAQISLDLSQTQDEKSLLWNRLKYTITPTKNINNPTISGIVSLSEIMPEIFELRAAATENVYAGMNYRIRVRAFHPVTNLPTANVKITARVKLDIDAESRDDKLELAANGKTDREGFAVLDFKIPENIKLDNDGDVKITGEKNGVSREAKEDLNNLTAQNLIYLNTDKPIYQPAQNFYARGLYMTQTGVSNRFAAANRELEFIIEDEDDTVLYRQTAKTSRFGIASIGWKIPENAKLGTYRIRVKDEGEEIGAGNFKVSRYDLPNFTVAVKPDKTYYLPADETAEITVSADYLFDKAVEKGAVKVVRETERRWNYKEQKYESEEENPVSGETDANGKFVARVDLRQAHKDLKEDEYRRFEDLHFAAYFTDSATNRTEQKRFDARVTKDAIHVYVVGVNSYDEHNPKLPVNFYVSTFYADGAPAACDVEIRGKYADENDAQTKILARLKTNSLGAGRAEFAAPKRIDETYFENLQIKVLASDASRKTGAQEEEIDIDEDAKQIRIRAAKAIYKSGEAINAEIVSTEPDADVFVDVVKDWSVVASRLVKLKNGRANLKIPFNPNFKGELTLAAYIDDGDDAIKGAAGVIFPHPTNLNLDVRMTKAVFRPNEEAKVNFGVKTPDKKQSETALGVFVFDKAIEERARADADSGGEKANQFGNYSQLLDSDLNRIDLSKSVSADLQLKAALLLADASFYPNFFDSDYYNANLKKTFETFFKRQFTPVENALEKTYKKDFTHPTDAASLQKILLENGIDFANLRDPWGNEYAAKFAVERDEDAVYIWSAGANKTFGGKDDFVVLTLKFKYFTPTGNAIDKAVRDFHARTNSFVRDYAALRGELRKQNIDLDNLKDRFNRPYQINFNVSGRFFTIDFKSSGADGKADESYNGDDFTVWTNRADYFADAEAKMQAVLSNYANAKKTFPQSENEFKAILKSGGVDFDSLRDGWNQSLYLEFAVSARYADKVKTEIVGKYGDKAAEKLSILPVTQQVAVFHVRSAGADKIKGTYDDFDLTTFSGVISEQSKTDAKPVELETETIFTGGKGAVRGVVKDPNGAVIPNITITAANEETSESFSAASNEDGIYILKNLPSGKYTIRAEASGFQTYVVQNVPVRSSTVSELNFEMNVGGVSSTVEVTSGAASVNSTDASMSSTTIENLPLGGNSNNFLLLQSGVAAVTKSGVSGKNVVNLLEENSTPRLREYFPETLVWQPELITDKNGRAELKFKLADNLTTWKLYAIGSNADGKIGVAEKEIKTFQPFFVDLEPPKFLTVGDEINLPVQIRNYTEKAQKVAVSMTRGNWFSFLNDANQTIEVLPNATRNAIFDFRADSVVKDGKQRVTAIAAEDSDAIEKEVVVRPNGKEIVQTRSAIFRDSAAFDVNFPADALPKTQSARMKIYPNLLAHVAESIEGLLKRPYGCGEQIVSSTYPNLMILKVAGNSKNALAPKLRAQAEKFLRQGYERLIGYQTADGGFSYWGGRDASDVALTAYALRFLNDARDFIEVNEDIINKANKWLLAQQRADGSWAKTYNWEKVEDKNRTKILTTYIARILAMQNAETCALARVQNIESLRKAFEYLKTRNAEIDEPFALASFALALFDANDAKTAQTIIEKLKTMAIAKGDGAYWNLETNTPFYGWGTAGRIETTALVVQALTRNAQVQSSKSKVQSPSGDVSRIDKEQKPKPEDLIAKGTIFLLKNKDRYGVWYSTQATVNVLDAILAVAGNKAETETSARVSNDNNSAARTAEIFVNGQKVKDAALPDANVLAYPIEVDLSGALSANDNRVEIKINGNTDAATAQIVSTHYVSWQDFAASGRNVNQSRQLRLDYNCDKTNAEIMREINCSVEAERVGFRGYGMLLAEIGLPPGADVDRASLEKAKEENWNFSRYDVLPDRIVIYLWAQAGGTRVNFKFKPRYGVSAQTAPSIIYDYYNSEAQATVAPLKFSIK